jgi:hypothetical protein
MANKQDRESAKKSISSKSTDDPELDEAIRAGRDFQLSILKENNRHTEEMKQKELGFFGRAFGGEKSAPTFIAAIGALLGEIGAGYTLVDIQGENTAAWTQQTEKLLAFTSACLAFIFGRGTK